MSAPGKSGRRGPGTELRLSQAVIPSHYAVHLTLDPATGRGYAGEVEVSLALHEETKHVVLHGCDLRVSAARFTPEAPEAGRRPRAVAAEVQLQPRSETLRVTPRKPLPAGEYRLRLKFRGKLRSDLRGLYFAESGGRRYAFTQLEAADARRFFPCFDEPAFKARLTLSVTTADAHTVISNAPAAKTVRDRERGTRTTYFETTERLSTYLYALAVGDLRGSRTVRCGDTPIRVWHAPGGEKMTRFALDAAKETLARLEKYFGTPYPYGKLDLVAVPDFEFGAMENAGAVFFRETLLLVDEKRASLPERKRAAEVICHELAHMWYGNLVTMAWWDDLWLNEAFATWMAFTIVDDWKPEWRMWSDFGHARNGALSMDALRHTHPIYTEVRRPDEASENFDLITYEKGASVVRMLERFLGPTTFRRGVRNYLRAHREGNAVAADLWRALQAVSKQPGLARMVRGWVEQPGFPLLSVERGQDAEGHYLRLRQSRFSAHGKARAGAERWAVPVVLRVGRGKGSRVERHLLKRASERIPLGKRAPTFVYANADEATFLRPLHDPAALAALGGKLSVLNGQERLGLVQHGWALTHSGHLALGDYLSLLWGYGEESDPDVLAALVSPLRHLVEGLAPACGPEVQARLRARIAEVFGPALARVGISSRRRDDDDLRLRRAWLVDIVGLLARDPDTLALAADRCDAYIVDRAAVDANLAGVLLSIGALSELGGKARFPAYLAASAQDPTPQARRRFRLSLSDFDDAGAAARLVDACLDGSVPTQDVAIVLGRALGNPAIGAAVWTLVTRRWSAISRRMPSMLISRFVAATPALGPFHRAEVASFFRRHLVPSASRALRQAEERFQLERAFRARCRAALTDAI